MRLGSLDTEDCFMNWDTDLYLEFGFRHGYISYVSVHPVHSSVTDVN